MYVRWKQRARRSGNRPTGFYTLSAVLVESERRDGKPRQHMICYLASINTKYIDQTAHQLLFWRNASAQLQALNLPAEQQQALEQKIRERIAVPTPEEITQLERDRAALMRRYNVVPT